MAAKKMGRPKSPVTLGPQMGVRFPAELVERLDAHVERMRESAPWAAPTRADAIRQLLAEALDVHERKRK